MFSKKLSTKEVTTIAIFTALTSIFSQIAIPLPFTPVPISLGLIAVYMSGILLMPKYAIISQLCYLLIGAVGLPVFGNFKGGMSALVGPTGGYLLMYPFMAGIVSFSLNSSKNSVNITNKKTYIKFIMSMICAHLLLYTFGTAWLSFTTNTSFFASVGIAIIPFIPLDIIKIIFCVIVIVPLRTRLLSMNLLVTCEK